MITSQATATASPVINFAEAPVRRRTKAECSATRLDHPDKELITACIKYAMQIRGALVVYDIDPTDSAFAAALDTDAQRKARGLLAAIMNSKPTTLDGLRSKASLTGIVIENWSGMLDQIERDFLVSIADDVIRYQRASAALGNSADVCISVSA